MIDIQSLKELARLLKLPANERVMPLLSFVRRAPDYTPAAIALLNALRQSGRLPKSTVKNQKEYSPKIPPIIVQYWDTGVPPPDVRALMETWQRQNREFEYLLFDHKKAQRFIERHVPKALHAYNRSGQVAQKCDIFRLAWLYARGGFYVDADDRCVAPISLMLPQNVSLTLYQEDVCSVGNNFIGAGPEQKVIALALDLAVDAVDRGDNDIIWLSTGPGLLTRALAQVIATDSKNGEVAMEDIIVLHATEMSRVASFHCTASYKYTVQHWPNASFARHRPKLLLSQNIRAV